MWTVIEILGALSVGMCGGFILGALFKDGEWRKRMEGQHLHKNPGRRTSDNRKVRTGVSQGG
jgi:hypothetical protein